MESSETTKTAELKSQWQSVLPIFMATLLAAIAFVAVCSPNAGGEQAPALAEGAKLGYGYFEGVRIQCLGADEEADECLEPAKQRTAQLRGLWLGNSQISGINDYQDGMQPAPGLAFALLEPFGIDLISFSQPNANFLEHYVMFEFVRSHLPLDILVLPAVFDDTREFSVRPYVMRAFAYQPAAQNYQQTEIGKELLTTFTADQSSPTSDEDFAGIDGTIQQSAEKALNDLLSDYWPSWGRRNVGRARINNFLYQSRNTIFGITAQSVRPRVQAAYARNMQAFEQILASAAAEHIDTFVYIAPIRNDIALPYHLHEYEQFKAEIQQLAQKHGAHFFNFERLVPNEHWGTTASKALGQKQAVDFMHFEHRGHLLLAEAVKDMISTHFSQEANQAAGE